MRRKVQRFGWVPDLPDHRDHFYAAPRRVVVKLPGKVDLRRRCPPVLDQGELGSCTAHAIANAHFFDQMKQKAAKRFLPSRLFIYYNERAMEGSIRSDAGAQIRDGIKTLVKQGACPERQWPYVVSRFAKKPPATAFKEAEKHQALLYKRLDQKERLLKSCLAEGYPFVFGITVYESFESDAVAANGKVPMPSKKEKSVGGHAMLAVGYDDRKKAFIVMNSWSTQWGDKGYCYIPYAYLLSETLAADFWTVRLVEQ